MVRGGLSDPHKDFENTETQEVVSVRGTLETGQTQHLRRLRHGPGATTDLTFPKDDADKKGQCKETVDDSSDGRPRTRAVTPQSPRAQ